MYVRVCAVALRSSSACLYFWSNFFHATSLRQSDTMAPFQGSVEGMIGAEDCRRTSGEAHDEWFERAHHERHPPLPPVGAPSRRDKQYWGQNLPKSACY